MRNYKLKTIHQYPDNGKHLECFIALPFQIRKGEDGYWYNNKKGKECTYNIYMDKNKNRIDCTKTDERWIVHLDSSYGSNRSLFDIFEIKVNKDLDKIVDYCLKIYEKSLKLELKRLKELKKEMETEV